MTKRIDHAIGAALCIGYVALLLWTAPAIGLARDESMYVTAARSYAGWFELLAREPSKAFERTEIDKAWRNNSEHPPLVKSLFALSYLADRELSLFTRTSLPYRFVGMLSAGALLWLIHVMGARLWNRRVGLFAALAFALLPRPFYHAHLIAFDVPITLAVTAVSYAYLRSLAAQRWLSSSLIACGVLYGAALATKHNSWVLPGIYAIHFAAVLIVAAVYRKKSGDTTSAAARPTSAFPRWLLAMIVLGVPLFLASWPWIWHDTWKRLNGYAAFHLHHDYYNIEYFGENYFWPPFPISYPFVMTLYTLPVTTLALALAGMLLRARAMLSDVSAAWRGGPPRDPLLSDVLLFGCALAPLVIIALPSTPIFGGTKHWFTAYPFMMLFAGVAFDRAMSIIGGTCAVHRSRPQARPMAGHATAFVGLEPPTAGQSPSGPTPSRRSLRSLFDRAHRIVPVALGALVLTPAAVETAHSHPFGLSHYGMAAGFVPGAADRGMNRQFWGFTTGSLVPFFNQHVPDGSRVYVCDTTIGAFRMLAEDGLISSRIRPTLDLAQSDFALVHHEKHMAEVDYQIWSAYGTTQPVYVLRYDGVPIISVYKRPK